MTRNGKIARLPEAIRDELNARLADGLKAKEILEWLNELPKTRSVLKNYFNGVPISPQNLSEWRKGGFIEWQVRDELYHHTREVSEQAAILNEFPRHLLVDDVATLLSARYAALLASWDGEVTPSVLAKIRTLDALCQSISRLQRNLHRARIDNRKVDAEEDKKDAAAVSRGKQLAVNKLLLDAAPSLYGAGFGGGPAGEYLAQCIFAINNDLPIPDVPSEEVLNQAESNQIKPQNDFESPLYEFWKTIAPTPPAAPPSTQNAP